MLGEQQQDKQGRPRVRRGGILRHRRHQPSRQPEHAALSHEATLSLGILISVPKDRKIIFVYMLNVGVMPDSGAGLILVS